MPTDKEIEAAAKAMRSLCYDLEQSSEFYKEAGVAWNVIAKAALSAADQERLRPISEAPKDGTEILLYHEEYEMLPIAYWDSIEAGDENGVGGYGGWHVSESFSSSDSGILWEDEDLMPTHFQFLPTRPEEKPNA